MKRNYRRKRFLILYPLQLGLVAYASFFFALGALTTKLIETLNLEGPIYLFGVTFPAFLLLLVPFAVAILTVYWGFRLTNRIAGPIFNLHRHMSQAADQENYSELRFRKGDYFRDVERAYNHLIKKIRSKDDSGFSLIELMVAIAIASILMTIAVPNYMKFSDKVRIQAGKGLLVAVFIAEKNFYAEHNTFTTRLDAIGFSASGKTYFNIGFTGDFPPPPFIVSDAACNELCNYGCALHREANCQLDALNGLDGDTPGFANLNAFQATGHAHFGKVFSGSGQVPYTIAIDQDKNLIDVVPAN
jgi:prepilin-type N-terminal cleavage/methylation domain-containing protein